MNNFIGNPAICWIGWKEYNMSSLIGIIAKVMKPLLLFANLIFLLVLLTIKTVYVSKLFKYV